MIISMQGNWEVTVKSKSASYQHRFIIQGATTGNGTHNGTAGTSVNVTGNQWTIAIQNKPRSGWQVSDTQIKFPKQAGGNYEFEIWSNDAGTDDDFNDLILTCSTPVNINDFILYGNVTLYSGRCIFNPCRRFPFVIETYPALKKALKNPLIEDWIKKYYPERIPPKVEEPNPPDPAPYFKPVVFDLSGEAMQPKSTLSYVRSSYPKEKEEQNKKEKNDGKKAKETASEMAASNFQLLSSSSRLASSERISALSEDRIKLATDIGRLFYPCSTKAGSNLTLTFEEYDRTAGELSGGAYTGTGNRELLGDTITDMHGNYIFRFSFDMTFPGLEDSSDIAPGEDVNTVMFPDVIVKIVEYSPYEVRYESAPFYNIPNLKRIDLCLPESQVNVTSTCFNGNLIGSLGNVFIGGNQNTYASTFPTNLRRYGNSNYLESNGVISVNSSLAGFNVECAAWNGKIDMKGCMYDSAKKASENKIEWYTIRIRRSGTTNWEYVSQNYKHPKFSKRNLPNYTGDDVGPIYPNTGGTLNGSVPAYINIQREAFVDGVDWEFSNIDRFMQLNTALYDIISGVRTPGTFYVRVDGYDSSGSLVPDATDLIPLFIHNNGLNFRMTSPGFSDPLIEPTDCGLYRLTDAQMKTPIEFAFQANDPHGFVNEYELTMGRCPNSALMLNAFGGNFEISGNYSLAGGGNSSNHHGCSGFTGSHEDFSNPGMIDVQIHPTSSGEGWIKSGEYFTIYTFHLTASQRITNGYNSGTSGTYRSSARIMMERLNP